MRSSAALLLGAVLLIVGAAVGGSVGYLMGQGDESPPTVPPVAARAATDGRGEHGETVASPPAAPASAPAAAIPRAGRSGAHEGSSSASPETGDGKITGKVLGPAGEPLVGALVRALPRFPWTEESAPETPDEAEEPAAGSPPPLEDPDVEIAAYAARLRRTRGATRETRTDASGAYEFTGLPSCDWQVEAWLAGWSVRRVGNEHTVAVGARVDFVASPLRTVVISVLLPDGRPAASASVGWEAVGGDGESSTEWSPKSPRATVSPGTYRFKASATIAALKADTSNERSGARWDSHRRHGHWEIDELAEDPDAVFIAEPQEVVVGEGETRVTLQLRSRPCIVADVKFAAAEHARSVRVAAVRLGAGAVESGGSGPDVLSSDARSGWTDGRSPVTLAGIDPGVYLVGVTFRGGRVGPTATVTVGTEPVTQSFTIDDDGGQDVVTLRVLGPDGAAITDVEIEHGVQTQGGSAGGSVNVAPAADGSFRVPHFSVDAPGLGSSSHSSGSADESHDPKYYIEVESPRFGKERAEYRPGADREVTIRLSEPATLRVTVTGLASEEDRSRALLFIEGAGRSYGSDGLEIPSSGVVTVNGLSPGAATIVLRSTMIGGRERRWRARYSGTVLARRDVTLVAGDNAVSVAVTPTSDLVVSFDASVGAPHLVATAPSDWGDNRNPRGVAEGDGQVRFADLIAGRYRLRSRAGEMTVDVPTTGVVAFRPRLYNAYHLDVQTGSYLAEIGMRTGDLVVAIDGAEFKDIATMEAALAVARTKATATFTIDRGGARIDIPTDANRFHSDEKSSFAPAAR